MRSDVQELTNIVSGRGITLPRNVELSEEWMHLNTDEWAILSFPTIDVESLYRSHYNVT